jgi:hypothetical protein
VGEDPIQKSGEANVNVIYLLIYRGGDAVPWQAERRRLEMEKLAGELAETTSSLVNTAFPDQRPAGISEQPKQMGAYPQM